MMHSHLKLLIKFPTRGRPEKFFNVLDQYIEKASDLSKVAFLISLDEDDSSMNNLIIKSRLDSYKQRCKLAYLFGNSKTKIQAINADMEKIDGWSIVLLASDDMVPIIKGYDDIIRSDMNEYFRDTDGVLWYNDGGQNNINTLCILGKKYYERFNYIYHPAYVSLWCDNEFTDVSVKLKKVHKSEKVIIEHQHPVYQKTNYDELYIRNESYFNIDKQTYEKRREINFDLDLNQPLLSILTPSVPERIDSHLKKLIDKLKKQIGNKNVEHLIFIDNRKRSIGAKRETLVQMANGKYMAFVDDDDDISNDYIDSLLEGIKHNPDVVTFKQYCHVNDNEVSVINFSLKNKTNEEYYPGGYINRVPFHVCAWKSELGKKYAFSDKNYSEDWFWAEQLAKEAKTEYHIDKVIHTYIYNDNVTTTPL
jgi:Glycosyl transferase family 2